MSESRPRVTPAYTATVVGHPSRNPLYHTGPITVLLFVIVLATGCT